ncbi:MAG: 4'-phosphopantetheinyl transferase superfamily protein [Solirubrobacterales bacterium]
MGRPRALPDWPPGPPRPGAPGDEVHLWLAEREPGSPGAERILRAVLGRYLEGEPEAIAIEPAPSGKPRLAERPERLRFNLSHSGDLVLVGIAAVEIGVDVERVAPRRAHLAIAERRLGEAAATAVREAGEERRAQVFTERWARFEASQKCLGLGVFDPAPAEDAVAVASLDVGPGYAAAFALQAGRLCPGEPNKRAWSLLG